MIPQEKAKVSALTGTMGGKVDEWAIWYSGDPNRIANYYARWIADRTPKGNFWAQLDKTERQTVVHEPLAADIAQTSANLLFSEPADIQFDDSGRPGQRITTFIEENGLQSKLLEGAELAAAMGGVYLKLDTNPDLLDVPILSTKTPEMAIPQFTSGRLTGITFWSIISTDDNKDKVFRLFEHRENIGGSLLVEYRLFEGNKDNIGQQVDLGAFRQTQQYVDVIYPNFVGLGCVYIPNVMPNRLYPGSSQGMSDYADCISMLDSLDETMTSWIRDITFGQGRIFADQEMFDVNRPVDPNFPSVGATENSSRFDPFQRIYQKIDMAGWKLEGSNAKPIDCVQFDIRVEEHSQTANDLIEKIVSRSGYAPQSFGLGIEGRAESGTALRLRERKSLMTQSKKAKYWAPQLSRLMFEMQQLDQATRLTGRYEIRDVAVVPSDSIVNDASDTAQTIKDLRAAEAVSTYISVKMAHPDWDEEAIKDEVRRINEEKGAAPIPDDQLGG